MRTILIAGLGNPGKKYELTRHNTGFRVLDKLAEKYSASFIEETKFKSQTSAFDLDENRIILAKPQTFMNNSGEAVGLLKNFFKLANDNILVVHDEIDLPLGKMRLSFDASAAGHNGIKSVIEKIKQNFYRLRIGIEGRKSRLDMDTYDYVLTNFTATEEKKLQKEIIPQAIEQIEKFLKI